MSKVLIADDSGIMRSAIVSTLDEDKEIAVIGEVGRQGWFPLALVLKRYLNGYFVFLVFSALILAQRAFAALEIAARPAADSVRRGAPPS
jgi:hypothetical protein